jgi:glutathione S-transferase
MAHRLKLVSFELCPYVERTRIVLLAKGAPHELAFIDLANKPEWFLRVSPMGRVPVLLVDDRPVFESMIINELVDELHPEPPLLPRAPLDRAEARSWIVFANDVLMPAGYQAMLGAAGGDAGAVAKQAAIVRDALGKLEAQVARGAGPFFLGATLSLVDAACAPFLRRWRLVEGWAGGTARLLGAFPAVARWADALAAHPAVRAAEPPDFAARSRALFAERAAVRASPAPT